MASSVIHSTRRTGNEHLPRSTPRQFQTSDCHREQSSREEFVTHFQHLRDDTLPEMERVERMLTRIVIAYGLEYCQLDIVAKSFLALSRDVRRLLVETRKAVLRDERASSMLEAVQQSATHSLDHFRDVITSDLACEEATPVYRRLIGTLINFEAKMNHVFAVHSSADAHAMQS